MQQWRDAKSRHPDALVFFRVGDFYEMFYEDAEEAARRLGLTLTSRNNGSAADVPLAGVPAKARDEYVQRLVRQGRRVAICEQVEDPAEAKGLVRREVVETITPGAVLSDALLTARRNNFLVALAGDGEDGAEPTALAAVDVSTGEVVVSPVEPGGTEAALARLEPAELLLPRSWENHSIPGADAVSRTWRPDWIFETDVAEEELRRRYGVHSLAGYGFQPEDGALVRALGALVAYLAEIQPSGLEHLRPPRIERPGDAMALDEMTRRNLELVEPLRPDLAGADPGRTGTLIDVVDETVTAMGGRLLRRWVLRPLIAAEPIWRRQEAVARMLEDAGLRRRIRAELQEVRDLERLAAKLTTGRITPRELGSLGQSLDHLPPLLRAWAESPSDPPSDSEPTGGLLAGLLGELDTLDDVRATIAGALADDPPPSLGLGGVIRAGHSDELDELRDVRDGARDFIAGLQQRERGRTGIGSLRVGYNKVFGYYLEVTRANLERVPEDYERRQTLANAERYVTPELKEWESKVLGAEERIGELESRLFGALRGEIAGQVGRLQATAEKVAQLDVLAGLAELAERRDYVRPEVHTGDRLEIRAGRHPVVETMMPREAFIPNDVALDDAARIMILTGPNMAGKSTLLRQVGLIQLMAQVGGYVPASSARLPVCDRIFTRVGASDNLVRGQSTFMMEMQETASILNGATRRSLVLLDEIGRGTATYDGVSIAWAVTEHLHETVGAKTIFATHYHELTRLADLLPALVNANVAVKEVGQDIVFLRRLQPGGADRSYGIQVARLAGLPAEVVARARSILRDLEGTHASGRGLGGEAGPAGRSADAQLHLFEATPHPVVARLRQVDVNALTPLQALNLLAELATEVRDSREVDP